MHHYVKRYTVQEFELVRSMRSIALALDQIFIVTHNSDTVMHAGIKWQRFLSQASNALSRVLRVRGATFANCFLSFINQQGGSCLFVMTYCMRSRGIPTPRCETSEAVEYFHITHFQARLSRSTASIEYK